MSALKTLVVLTTLAQPLVAATYYIAPTGNDSTGAGTLASPWKTLTKAEASATTGDTIILRGGTYSGFSIEASDTTYNYVHNLTKSGITYSLHTGDAPAIFDFTGFTTAKRVAAFRIASSASVTFNGPIEVKGVPVGSQKQSECFRVEGTAHFRRVNCHDNAANGFYFTIHGDGSCHRCDSYNNIGTSSASVGNTDGFGAHSDGVTFTECRAWRCSDDGYDCIASAAANTFDHCWAYNMTAGGDSNGFKIGGWGSTTPPATVPSHTVRYCLSAKNNAHGFYANHHPGKSATWTNNTAYNNAGGNFNMLERVSVTNATDIPGTREVIHNCLAFTGTAIEESNLPAANESNNSWTKSVTVNSADFQSTDATQMDNPRHSDGSMPSPVTFMHLVSGSDLVGLGCF